MLFLLCRRGEEYNNPVRVRSSDCNISNKIDSPSPTAYWTNLTCSISPDKAQCSHPLKGLDRKVLNHFDFELVSLHTEQTYLAPSIDKAELSCPFEGSVSLDFEYFEFELGSSVPCFLNKPNLLHHTGKAKLSLPEPQQIFSRGSSWTSIKTV
jgi:hypothetical protein